ncbi:MAG: acetyl-CoA C-acetyltransferase [Spirochaetales bacterium]|nr:acetyl-CoA C-acetyltransferase [Spirochaetales bacterium]
MKEVVIAGPVRTAIGSFGGALTTVPAVELGRIVIRETLRRAGIAAQDVDEVIMGNVLQAGLGSNTARQAALLAELPVTTPAYTVNKVCASGMKAITLGALSIAAGEADIIVAGGIENMSSAPYSLPNLRWGQRLGDGEAVDIIIRDALSDPLDGCHMGITAENLAEEYSISRETQDAFAVESQRKTAQALDSKAFEDEIVTVPIPRRKSDPLQFRVDEFPRPGTTLEGLAKLKPAFKSDGAVTAGNSSGINDGAAAVVLLNADEAEARGIRPVARIVSFASAAVEPMRMGMGPVPATRKALDHAGLALSDIDVIELNEAFAAQSIAVLRELDLDPAKVNLNGGAISLGHPVGATGARILVTLLNIMEKRNYRLGLATLCIGGGQGMALIVERT